MLNTLTRYNHVKMNYKKKQNKGMILLVAVMFLAVLLSNSAYAVQLSNIHVTGSGDIEGVRHPMDYTSVSVQVINIGNDTNVMSQLTFTTPHFMSSPPSNCDGGGSSYTRPGASGHPEGYHWKHGGVVSLMNLLNRRL